MLSSTFKLNRSIIKKTIAPLNATIINLAIDTSNSNTQRARNAIPKDPMNPATYPSTVLWLYFGKEQQILLQS